MEFPEVPFLSPDPVRGGETMPLLRGSFAGLVTKLEQSEEPVGAALS